MKQWRTLIKYRESQYNRFLLFLLLVDMANHSSFIDLVNVHFVAAIRCWSVVTPNAGIRFIVDLLLEGDDLVMDIVLHSVASGELKVTSFSHGDLALHANARHLTSFRG